MYEFPVLQTERLLPRKFLQSDAQAVFSIFSLDIVTKYHNADRMETIEQAENEVRASLLERGLGIRWGIALREQMDAIIGSCAYYNLNKAFAPPMRRRGIGARLYEALFSGLPHERAILTVREENLPARGFYEKRVGSHFCRLLHSIRAWTVSHHGEDAEMISTL